MHRPPIRAVLAAAAAAVVVLPAAAQTPPPGRLLASNCFQCHGTNGKGGFDSIAGKSAAELFEKLKAFQSGKEGDGIMARHALGYSDEQIRQLAGWLSQQR